MREEGTEFSEARAPKKDATSGGHNTWGARRGGIWALLVAFAASSWASTAAAQEPARPPTTPIGEDPQQPMPGPPPEQPQQQPAPQAQPGMEGQQQPILPPEAQDVRQEISTELAEAPVGKVGPFMLNLKAGVGIGLSALDETFALQLDAGYAVVKGSSVDATEGDLYVVISPELHLGDATILSLPVGVQYDIPTPIRGLYVYPRLTLGFSIVWDGDETLREDDDTQAAFSISPALGLKYVANETVNIGLEPAVFPIHFAEDDTFIQYLLLGYVGVNF